MKNLTKCLLLALTLTLGLMAAPASFAQLFVSVQVAPPPLPVYEQPPCPAPGYIWTPGYWAWSQDDGGYFWVPGTWVPAPQPGYLWTPGYWAWNGGYYVWRPGYWGPTVGFYGGIDYGFGYFGTGYSGGYWRDRTFYYNRAVNNVNITVIRNVYRRDVPRHDQDRRTSYNGGHGGIAARAPQREPRGLRVAPTRDQQQQREQASRNRAQFDQQNHGRPAVAATPRPGAFDGSDAGHAGRPSSGPTQPRAAQGPHRPQPAGAAASDRPRQAAPPRSERPQQQQRAQPPSASRAPAVPEHQRARQAHVEAGPRQQPQRPSAQGPHLRARPGPRTAAPRHAAPAHAQGREHRPQQ